MLRKGPPSVSPMTVTVIVRRRGLMSHSRWKNSGLVHKTNFPSPSHTLLCPGGLGPLMVVNLSGKMDLLGKAGTAQGPANPNN